MNIFPKPNSENIFRSHPTSSADGCERQDSERSMENLQPKHSVKDTCLNGQAEELAPTIMFGTEQKRLPCWSEEVSNSFTVRKSGNIGQEILDPDGVVTCWTTDPWLAQVIAHLLEKANREGLLT